MLLIKFEEDFIYPSEATTQPRVKYFLPHVHKNIYKEVDVSPYHLKNAYLNH
jgi:hypothetical protein